MVTAMYLGEILHALNVDGNFTTTISDKTFLKAIVGGDNQNAAGTINFSFEGLFDNEGITEMDFAIVIFGTTDEHIFVNKAELSFKKEGDQPNEKITVRADFNVTDFQEDYHRASTLSKRL